MIKSVFISALLWMIRSFGFDLQCEGGRLVYVWLRTPAGKLDHWFESPRKRYEVVDLLSAPGFRHLAWQILTSSALLFGRQRAGLKAAAELRSVMFACHGNRDLNINSSNGLDVDTACRWLIVAIRWFDREDRPWNNRQVRVAGENLRTAAHALVGSLARKDPGIAELIRQECAGRNPFPTGPLADQPKHSRRG